MEDKDAQDGVLVLLLFLGVDVESSNVRIGSEGISKKYSWDD